ncbi:hypothetical protein FV232_06930 [Methylobacterium sp. WL30]|uniref:hypothetical protein n=1 Tax=unclassified Methylobacterium TaxID=2615210 RepID=UPI0011C6FD00|nr:MULTISPECIES: hypothetical protein [unclassified Methylobacterium]TXN40445.1 hypothetical protein FV225_06175 [Methylobacterium sp. WL93]TXN49154.1 hypothetical protein FV227_17900 [Methylobacterium sp. WL119]TXN68965.1 hypothetical protein FV232_06930 [Methylobacterium sp. WL30]
MALQAYIFGAFRYDPSLSIPFCPSEEARPKLGATDKGLIYDLVEGQLLQWSADHWITQEQNSVTTWPFIQSDPRFADVPRMGSKVTCLPGTYAGFPVPKLSYKWFVDGEQYHGGSVVAQFGMNADELAFMKQGRQIECEVTAEQVPYVLRGDALLNRVSSRAIGYIRPAMPA